jgi:1,4-alpha-glucan branching enzyme
VTARSLLTADDLFLFNEGTHHALGEKMGAHPVEGGAVFAVWAPDADAVSVVGDFNGWTSGASPLEPRGTSGLWEGFVAGLERGALYKFRVRSTRHSFEADKSDPYGLYFERPPRTAAVVWSLDDYEWGDAGWMAGRAEANGLGAPISTYEVHLGSWMRGDGGRRLSYAELAPRLADHAERTGFTHIEILPVMEHPFYGSWGYQTTGYFAPTSRYGTPQEFMALVDHLHQRGFGVILDWVPSHFPTDEWALGRFDGSHLYEHADPRRGIHPDWDSYIFNYGRNEVRSFLLSSAMHWLNRYHADGLRVDAVASMLYLDYSREQGQWEPNEFGGRENLGAVSFLRRLNEDVYRVRPDVQTVAEESTSWPMVSRPTDMGGLGFGMKWDMGWMHDALRYMSREPIYRRWHHNDLTFRGLYAFTENFVLPLSHDEVVHGKGSLIRKMPGDDWQRFANLRLLFGYQWAQPGKNLLFMGGEFAQWREWDHQSSLDWYLLDSVPHVGMVKWVHDLNELLRAEPALHELDTDPAGIEWVEANDAEFSVLAFLRRGRAEATPLLVVCNFTPVVRHVYHVGVPTGGTWMELLNSDAEVYGGSGVGNLGGVEAAPPGWHARPFSVPLTLPPLACLFLAPRPEPASGP